VQILQGDFSAGATTAKKPNPRIEQRLIRLLVNLFDNKPVK
jgi:hypothetical protein